MTISLNLNISRLSHQIHCYGYIFQNNFRIRIAIINGKSQTTTKKHVFSRVLNLPKSPKTLFINVVRLTMEPLLLVEFLLKISQGLKVFRNFSSVQSQLKNN